jgi:hypothetical protein
MALVADPLTICLAVGSLILDLHTAEIELRWVHSVQKIVWTEQWRAGESGMVPMSASVEGSGAGMEPGDNAVRTAKGWTWQPALPPQRELVFARSDALPDWQICRRRSCHTVQELSGVPPGPPFRLAPCRTG